MELKTALRPRRVVDAVLVPYERELFEDAPSMRSFVITQGFDFLALVAVLWIMASADDPLVSRLGLVMITVICGMVMLRAYIRTHTRYVLTNYRAIRVSGWLRRNVEWLTWSKVTDVSVRRTIFDRLFGTATVKIMSANEQSGFKAMSDLSHPKVFVGWVTDLVSAKQGPVSNFPPGSVSDG